MAREFDEDVNPYEPPESSEWDVRGLGPSLAKKMVIGKVRVPAICLLVVGSIGLLASIVNIMIAVVSPPPVVDPNATEFMQGFQQGQVGPVAIVIQSVFTIVNLVIMFGAIQMIRIQTRILAIIASIMSILNVGTCCCILGAPVGIWSLIVLSKSNVIALFEATAEE